MGDVNNDLAMLARQLRDAWDDVKSAGRLATELYRDTLDPDDPAEPGWSGMGELINRLAALSDAFAALVPETVAQAFRDAEEYLDDH